MLSLQDSPDCREGQPEAKKTMDFVFVAAVGALVAVTLALVAGCAALERRR